MTRRMKLRCSQCLDEHQFDYESTLKPLNYRKWENVEVVEPRGDGYLCRCRNCGHEYLSYSKAAWRKWKAQERTTEST